MDRMGHSGETAETTDGEDHQRTIGIRPGKVRTLGTRHMVPSSRTHTVVAAISRLEQEHIALLLALCDLEESLTNSQDAMMHGALYLLLREDLRRTQHALKRASQGTYGICEVCQQPLSRRQLSLLPAMTRCSACTGRALHEH